MASPRITTSFVLSEPQTWQEPLFSTSWNLSPPRSPSAVIVRTDPDGDALNLIDYLKNSFPSEFELVSFPEDQEIHAIDLRPYFDDREIEKQGSNLLRWILLRISSMNFNRMHKIRRLGWEWKESNPEVFAYAERFTAHVLREHGLDDEGDGKLLEPVANFLNKLRAYYKRSGTWNGRKAIEHLSNTKDSSLISPATNPMEKSYHTKDDGSDQKMTLEDLLQLPRIEGTHSSNSTPTKRLSHTAAPEDTNLPSRPKSSSAKQTEEAEVVQRHPEPTYNSEELVKAIAPAQHSQNWKRRQRDPSVSSTSLSVLQDPINQFEDSAILKRGRRFSSTKSYEPRQTSTYKGKSFKRDPPRVAPQVSRPELPPFISYFGGPPILGTGALLPPPLFHPSLEPSVPLLIPHPNLAYPPTLSMKQHLTAGIPWLHSSVNISPQISPFPDATVFAARRPTISPEIGSRGPTIQPRIAKKSPKKKFTDDFRQLKATDNTVGTRKSFVDGNPSWHSRQPTIAPSDMSVASRAPNLRGSYKGRRTGQPQSCSMDYVNSNYHASLGTPILGPHHRRFSSSGITTERNDSGGTLLTFHGWCPDPISSKKHRSIHRTSHSNENPQPPSTQFYPENHKLSSGPPMDQLPGEPRDLTKLFIVMRSNDDFSIQRSIHELPGMIDTSFPSPGSKAEAICFAQFVDEHHAIMAMNAIQQQINNHHPILKAVQYAFTRSRFRRHSRAQDAMTEQVPGSNSTDRTSKMKSKDFVRQARKDEPTALHDSIPPNKGGDERKTQKISGSSSTLNTRSVRKSASVSSKPLRSESANGFDSTAEETEQIQELNTSSLPIPTATSKGEVLHHKVKHQLPKDKTDTLGCLGTGSSLERDNVRQSKGTFPNDTVRDFEVSTQNTPNSSTAERSAHESKFEPICAKIPAPSLDDRVVDESDIFRVSESADSADRHTATLSIIEDKGPPSDTQEPCEHEVEAVSIFQTKPTGKPQQSWKEGEPSQLQFGSKYRKVKRPNVRNFPNNASKSSVVSSACQQLHASSSIPNFQVLDDANFPTLAEASKIHVGKSATKGQVVKLISRSQSVYLQSSRSSSAESSFSSNGTLTKISKIDSNAEKDKRHSRSRHVTDPGLKGDLQNNDSAVTAVTTVLRSEFTEPSPAYSDVSADRCEATPELVHTRSKSCLQQAKTQTESDGWLLKEQSSIAADDIQRSESARVLHDVSRSSAWSHIDTCANDQSIGGQQHQGHPHIGDQSSCQLQNEEAESAAVTASMAEEADDATNKHTEHTHGHSHAHSPYHSYENSLESVTSIGIDQIATADAISSANESCRHLVISDSNSGTAREIDNVKGVGPMARIQGVSTVPQADVSPILTHKKKKKKNKFSQETRMWNEEGITQHAKDDRSETSMSAHSSIDSTGFTTRASTDEAAKDVSSMNVNFEGAAEYDPSAKLQRESISGSDSTENDASSLRPEQQTAPNTPIRQKAQPRPGQGRGKKSKAKRKLRSPKQQCDEFGAFNRDGESFSNEEKINPLSNPYSLKDSGIPESSILVRPQTAIMSARQGQASPDSVISRSFGLLAPRINFPTQKEGNEVTEPHDSLESNSSEPTTCRANFSEDGSDRKLIQHGNILYLLGKENEAQCVAQSLDSIETSKQEDEQDENLTSRSPPHGPFYRKTSSLASPASVKDFPPILPSTGPLAQLLDDTGSSSSETIVGLLTPRTPSIGSVDRWHDTIEDLHMASAIDDGGRRNGSGLESSDEKYNETLSVEKTLSAWNENQHHTPFLHHKQDD